MLSNIEKIIFIIIAFSAFSASYVTFGKMFKAISVGSQPIDWKKALWNFPKGLKVFISQNTLFKTRPIVGFIHALVAWGFTLYLIVNVVDVLYGFIPDFHFFPNYFIGKMYRIFVDVFTVLVLVGVFYFLVRRFIFNDKRLIINKPVMISEEARIGMRNDSLLVGLFILFHVGARFLSASFEIAKNGVDDFQPAATTVSLLWSNLSSENIILFEHITWWIALGLILGFLPYFPFSKHAHLFMGPLNYMVKEERSSMAAIETIDFEDDSIDQFGAGQINHLPQSNLLDAYACIQCSRCQDACPAYETGKELSPSALEIN
ncbi:[Fe-S]-binding protein, partial [bacterium]|nr:[Fe-S]-binding protein [bacterium]